MVVKLPNPKYVPEPYKQMEYPGQKVQIDVIYVPKSCLVGAAAEEAKENGGYYYQYTFIDEYSRFRYLEAFKEHNFYSSSEFIKHCVRRFPYAIECVQTDNGPEFTNRLNSQYSDKKTLFEVTLEKLCIRHKLIKPYTPRHNGKIERSHRKDNEYFYASHKFYSFEDFRNQLAVWQRKYNNFPMRPLNWHSPKQVLSRFSLFKFAQLIVPIGGADEKLDRIRPQEGASIMYTYEKRIRALQKYEETGSVTETIRTLGYPERQTLYRWIQERDRPVKVRSSYRGQNTPSHPRHPSVELKLEVLHRCFELGEDVKSVADEIGYSRASIYVWRRKYLQKGTIALMTPNDDPRGELKAGIPSSSEEVNQLKAKLQDMQMEIDILKETINVLKKDPGIDLTTLKNREKAAIIDALKSKYSLPKLLLALRLPHSSYYYQQKASGREDKYVSEKERIREIFEENHRCYGYRRIHASLYKEGIRLSEKVIRRLMKENGLRVMAKKKRAYSSYRGEITPSVPNLLQRDFHANMPNEKWLTDITEFAIPAGKVYLSPMIDCFDGMPVCWNISTTPDAALVNKMLDEATLQLKEGDHPIVHTDRGCHYRWPGWIDRMATAHLTRSMSKKGCSSDNSACEGFFGRMKNEMFYDRPWAGVTIDAFIQIIHNYMIWYREKRIKISLGGMSPVEYRQSLGLCT